MPRIEIELSPVDHVTNDAIGPPGERVFYMQGKKDRQVVTLILEKFQLQSLSIGIETFLSEIVQRFPDLPEDSANYEPKDMQITPPVEPLFRIANIELGYNMDDDLVILIIQELLPDNTDEEPGSVRFWCTRSQLRVFGLWGINVVSSGGRQICPQCGEPEEPEGHFCVKKNGGHKRD